MLGAQQRRCDGQHAAAATQIQDDATLDVPEAVRGVDDARCELR
jgi:hypothetical protein